MNNKIELGMIAGALLFSSIKAGDVEINTKFADNKLKAQTRVEEMNNTSKKQVHARYKVSENLTLGGEAGLVSMIKAQGIGHTAAAYIKIGNKAVSLEMMPEHAFYKSWDQEHQNLQEIIQITGKLNLKGKHNKLNLAYQRSDDRSRRTVSQYREFKDNWFIDRANLNYEFLNNKNNLRITTTAREIKKVLEDKTNYDTKIESFVNAYKYVLDGLGLEFDVNHLLKGDFQSIEARPAFDIIHGRKLLRTEIEYISSNHEKVGGSVKIEYGKDVFNSKKLERKFSRKEREYKGLVQEGYKIWKLIQESYGREKAKLDVPLSLEAGIRRSLKGEKGLDWRIKAMIGLKDLKLYGGYSENNINNGIDRWNLGFYAGSRKLCINGEYSTYRIFSERSNRFSVKLNYGVLRNQRFLAPLVNSEVEK